MSGPLSDPTSGPNSFFSRVVAPARSNGVTAPLAPAARQTAPLKADQSMFGIQASAEAPSLSDVAEKARKALFEETLKQADDTDATHHSYTRFGGASAGQLRELNHKATELYAKALSMATSSEEALAAAFNAMRSDNKEMVGVACERAFDLARSGRDVRTIQDFAKVYGYSEIAKEADDRVRSFP